MAGGGRPLVFARAKEFRGLFAAFDQAVSLLDVLNAGKGNPHRPRDLGTGLARLRQLLHLRPYRVGDHRAGDGACGLAGAGFFALRAALLAAWRAAERIWRS